MRIKRWYEKNYLRSNKIIMKKILLLTSFFLFISCSTNDEWQGVMEETWEIVDWYIDTLETSVQDAKDVKVLMEERQNIYK